MKILGFIDQFLDSLSKKGLVLATALMLSLTLVNIVLRWLDTSLLWIEPLVRHLVFAAAFLGGCLATSRSSHIAIDLVQRLLEARQSQDQVRWLQVVHGVFCFITSVGLVYAGFQLSQQEFTYGKEAFLAIHSGYLVSIIPIGFVMIGYRFFYLSLMQIQGHTPSQDSTS